MNMTRVNLPRAGCPLKLSDCATRGLVTEATKTPMTHLKELKAELGETLHTTNVAQALR